MDDLWRSRYGDQQSINLVFDTEGLGDLAVFLVYFFVAILASFAFLSFFVGGLKIFLAGSHEDDLHSAKHTFYTSLVSLIVAVALFLSLDYIFILVKDLSKNIG